MLKKNNIKYLMIILVIALFRIINVEAASNPYTKVTSWGDVNCTWSAWQETFNRTGIALPGFGNAKNWYDDAKKAGFAVGSEPKAKSIIVLDNYLDYGHVAFVDSIKDGKLYVWDSVKCYREMTEEEHNKWWDCIINNTTSADDEYKCDYLKVLEEAPCEYSKENGNLDKVVGYIYVTEPRKATNIQNNESPSNNTSKNNKNSKSNNNKVSTKSNNNYLKELKVEGIEFKFNKDILEYNLEVPYETTSIKMSAKVEDEKSKLTMENEGKLEIGNNKFNIMVTAEDKTVRNYVINIKRLEKVETNVNAKLDENKLAKADKKKSSKNIIILIIGGSIIGTGILVTTFIIIRKRKKLHK